MSCGVCWGGSLPLSFEGSSDSDESPPAAVQPSAWALPCAESSDSDAPPDPAAKPGPGACSALGQRNRRTWLLATIIVVLFEIVCLHLREFVPDDHKGRYILNSLSASTNLALSVVFQCLRDSSRLACDAAKFLVIAWLYSSFPVVADLMSGYGGLGYGSIFLGIADRTLLLLYAFIAMGSIQKRVETIEAAFRGQRSRNWGIAVARWSYLVIQGVRYAVKSEGRLQGWYEDDAWYDSSIYKYVGYVAIVSWTAVALFSWCSLGAVLRAVMILKDSNDRYLQAEAVWAYGVISELRCATIAMCLTGSSLDAFWRAETLLAAVLGECPTWFDRFGEYCIPGVTSNFEVLLLLYVVGFFEGRRPHLEYPRCRLTSSEAAGTGQSVEWVAVVEALGSRSIDAAALLSFYGKLGPGGSAMPHYDPFKHTTNDVCRQAIIPLSRVGSGGVAYASLEGLGGGAPPERMVTHSWSNTFLHLVAAILADALGREQYEDIAAELAKHGGRRLSHHLLASGGAHRRYWVCCFCVNQHAGICGGFGRPPPQGTGSHARWERSRRDSVTGKFHPLCTCEEPKAFNDKPEQCELNKFDDMMAFLHRTVPDFRQVLIVDREFDVFSRLWCVAELVQAASCEIPQSVKIASSSSFDVDAEDCGDYSHIATLSVADCNASRPEDKDEIMGKIPDLSAFDAQVKALVIGSHGLMSRHLVGFDFVVAAAASARRLHAASGRLSERCSSSDSDDSEGA